MGRPFIPMTDTLAPFGLGYPPNTGQIEAVQTDRIIASMPYKASCHPQQENTG